MAESRDRRRRSSQTVHVSELGFEDGKKRFGSSETGDAVAPYVCTWRNNLTALSQRYNLYFVATGDQIQVFQPSFPFQVLSDRPALVITPPLAKDGNPGYIQQSLPHGINNIVIGDLGEEEIVLLSCDDGNVAAFRTKAIINEINRQETDLVKHNGHEIQAFFSQNVGQSAWGLAIHTRARMIAVSSNTKEITVFALCLVDQQSDSETDDSMEEGLFDADADVNEWKSYNSTSGLSGLIGPAERRNHNIMITLEGHDANIPSVAFFNSDHDPEGRWLISTDIGGQIRVWDIWSSSGTCLSEFRSWTGGRRYSESDHSTLGWSVLCVDHRAFRLVESLSEALGTSSRRTNALKKPPLDITETVRFVSNYSENYAGTVEADTDSEMEPDESDLYGSVGDVLDPDDLQPDSGAGSEVGEINMLEDYSIPIESPPPFSPGEEPEFTSPLSVSHEENTNEDNASEVVLDGESSDDEDRVQDPLEGEGKDSAQSGKVFKRRLNTNASRVDPARTAVHPRETARLHGKQWQPKYVSDASASAPDLRPLPFAFLHTTASGIFLYPDSLNTRPEPSICCFGCLDQELPLNLEWLNGINRLNMAVQIPELGIVILATQKGRAVVLTLTKLKHSNVLGFRLEWILPFKSQEEKNWRPHYPLLGLAVAPVQGREVTTATTTCFGPSGRPSNLLTENESQHGFRSTGEKEAWRGVESSRRYRLLMTYYDHSVLSYDISWNGGGVKESVADPGHEDLLVV